MARKLAFRPTLPDTKRANDGGQRHWSAMSGKPIPDGVLNNVPARKTRAPSQPSLLPTEAEVQKAIITYLCANPKVCLVERHNSGAVTDGNYYVQFHHIYGSMGKRVRKADICGLLRDGRMFAIEVKRPPFTGPRNEREVEQGNYLELVRSCGGIGIFAVSVDDVRKFLT